MNESGTKSSTLSTSHHHQRPVKPKYVMKLCFHYLVSNALYLMLVPLFCIAFTHLSTYSIQDLAELSEALRVNNYVTISIWLLLLLLWVCTVFVGTLNYLMSRPRRVYLVNFACYKPGKDQMVSGEGYLKIMKESQHFTEESLAFQKKVLERSGLGQTTYSPKGLFETPINQCMAEARKETEEVMFGAIDELLVKTGVKPRDIGFLIVNSSTFNPTPSLSAAIVNHYKLRGNISSYNLGGMGCSAGLISIDLAKQLLQAHRNSYALVVSTENITTNLYSGNNPSMLVTNTLFRVGGAAILLSNRSSDRGRSKYELVHTLRTHMGADDRSYNCVFQQEDEDKKVGVTLSKELMAVAGEALKVNITTLGPLVLPLSEQLLFLATLIAKKAWKMKMKPYIPDFKTAFEHFCIHAGGRAVLDGIEKSLELSEWHMEPSRMSLYRFGNTSSSSLWYELAYLEAKGRIKKRDRIWQIAFGSGFKCNSAVWRALKTIKPAMEMNPWTEEINEFPVEVPNVATIPN